MNALTYRGVCKSFGDVRAINFIDLDIPEGEIFGLLGPNGAGKTTLIRMTMGILLPDTGVISIFGEAFSRRHSAILGYLPEERGIYPKMKVLELVEYFGRLRGLGKVEARRRAGTGLEKLGLAEWGDKKVEALSKGMQQKIQFLIALIHCPKIAILDEPFSGLDPVNVELFKKIIQEAREGGTTIILSTHQMEQVEKFCGHIALINKGDVVLRGRVDEIRRSYGTRDVRVEFAEEAPANGVVKEIAETISCEGREARYRMKDGVRPGEVVLALLQKGYDITEFQEAQASMHDIFIRIVNSGEEPEDGR